MLHRAARSTPGRSVSGEILPARRFVIGPAVADGSALPGADGPRVAPARRGLVADVTASLLVTLGGGFAAAGALGFPATGVDDADIFLVYARHLARGLGLVYSPHGERVEGFTSLAWVLVGSLPYRLGLPPETFLRAASAAAVALAILVVLRIAPGRRTVLILLATSPAFFAWTIVSGMESGLVTLVVTAAAVAAAKGRPLLLAGVLPVFVVTRPESLLWGLCLVALLAFRHGLRGARLPFATFLVTCGGLLAFRLSYFGFPLPNTWYAKVSPDRAANLRAGAVYFAGFVASHPLVPCALLLAAAAIVRAMRRREGFRGDDAAALALAILPGLAIPVVLGGDHFGSFRFYQPLFPLLALLVAMESAVWTARMKPVPAATSALLVGALMWGVFPRASGMRLEFEIAERGRRIGRAIGTASSGRASRPTVAVISAGGVQYGYDGPVLDLMGLNWVAMAHAPGPRTGFRNHQAFQPEPFWRERPDLLVPGTSEPFDDGVLKGLPSSARFRAEYELRPVDGDPALRVWFRKGYRN